MPDAIWAVSRLPPDLSRDPGLAPVSTPLRFLTTRHQRFALARLPDPHLTRSSPRLFRNAHHERHLTDAACGGLKPPPAGRPRRTYLHLPYSTAVNEALHHFGLPSSVRDTRPAQTPALTDLTAERGHAFGTRRLRAACRALPALSPPSVAVRRSRSPDVSGPLEPGVGVNTLATSSRSCRRGPAWCRVRRRRFDLYSHDGI
jgi:hypothetical protein